MNTLVVYKSKTGFTQTYAEAIAARLNTTAKPVQSVTADELAKADQVVYGGWMLAGKISGLAGILPKVKGRLVVFAVGATPAAKADVAAIRKASGIGDASLTYLEGGFRFERLNGFMKLMMRTFAKMAAKGNDANPEGMNISELIGANFDHTDVTTIEPVVAAAQA